MNKVDIPSQYGGGPQKPDRGIIHAHGEFIEAGEIDYFAKDWLDKLEVSAHYLVTPSGVIIVCRDIFKIAWHAKGHNTNTVGIEILVAGVHTYGTFLEKIKKPYMFGDQYTALVGLCKELNLPKWERHSDVSPGRKFDPGDGLDWKTLMSDIK